MRELEIHELPPSMQVEAFQAQQMMRGMVLQSIAKSEQQREQVVLLKKNLTQKARRRARRAQKRKH